MIKELNEDYCPFPPDSCVCIDEGGIEMFSRNFKAFDMELVKLFKLVRHHKLYVRIYSQSFDIVTVATANGIIADGKRLILLTINVK